MSQTDERNTGPEAEAERESAAPPSAPSANQIRQAPAGSLEFLLDIPLELKVEMGRTRVTMGELMRLSQGSVIELDRPAGDRLDILANGKLVARAEAVIVGDRYGVRILEVVGANEAGSSEPENDGGVS